MKNIFSSTRSHHFKCKPMFGATVVFLDFNQVIKSLEIYASKIGSYIFLIIRLSDRNTIETTLKK